MSSTVKTGWLKDKNGNILAPKTLTSQVQTSDGVLIEDKIQADKEGILSLISALSTAVNNFLDVDDETKDQLSEIIALIDSNKDVFDAITTSKINVTDIVDNLTTNHSSKVLSAAQGVVIKNLIDVLRDDVAQKSQVQIVTWEDDD